MKIYFEDGELIDVTRLTIKPDFCVDAKNGVTNNINLLDIIKETDPNAIIYTNSIFAFDNKYAWNNELKVPDICIRATEYMIFKCIDTLTDKELRRAHNLAKMYVAGAFNN